MLPSRKWRLFVSLLAFVGAMPHLCAVVGEVRMYHGKKVQCLHGGAWLYQDLGVYSRAQLYKEQVFTGTAKSAAEISFTDRRIQIVPDEVFLGDVSGEVTATMNQACLSENPPEIKAGEKWLFFLRTQYDLRGSPYYVVDFDSPAKPVSLAEYEICLLRLRSDIDESCIALMPVRPSKHPPVCALKLSSPFSFTSPFPRTSQGDKIEMSHITAPAEFRRHNVNEPTTRHIVQIGESVPSCSSFGDLRNLW